jgi:hypothetical protein
MKMIHASSITPPKPVTVRLGVDPHFGDRQRAEKHERERRAMAENRDQPQGEDGFFGIPKWRDAQQVIYGLTDDDGAIDVPAVIQGLWELWGLNKVEGGKAQ